MANSRPLTRRRVALLTSRMNRTRANRKKNLLGASGTAIVRTKRVHSEGVEIV